MCASSPNTSRDSSQARLPRHEPGTREQCRRVLRPLTGPRPVRVGVRVKARVRARARGEGRARVRVRARVTLALTLTLTRVGARASRTDGRAAHEGHHTQCARLPTRPEFTSETPPTCEPGTRARVERGAHAPRYFSLLCATFARASRPGHPCRPQPLGGRCTQAVGLLYFWEKGKRFQKDPWSWSLEPGAGPRGLPSV